MPCCCKTNLEAASIIGSFFMFLNFSLFFISMKYKEIMISEIVTCISAAFVDGILIYGVDKRNRSALLIWIIFQVIALVALIIYGLAGISALGLLTASDDVIQGNFLTSNSEKYWSGGLVCFISMNASIRTELADSMVTPGEPGGD